MVQFGEEMSRKLWDEEQAVDTDNADVAEKATFWNNMWMSRDGRQEAWTNDAAGIVAVLSFHMLYIRLSLSSHVKRCLINTVSSSKQQHFCSMVF